MNLAGAELDSAAGNWYVKARVYSNECSPPANPQGGA
jgi:hypothetical protein